jgi:hypothetical protein
MSAIDALTPSSEGPLDSALTAALAANDEDRATMRDVEPLRRILKNRTTPFNENEVVGFVKLAFKERTLAKKDYHFVVHDAIRFFVRTCCFVFMNAYISQLGYGRHGGMLLCGCLFV